jgi:hypothetical protein
MWGRVHVCVFPEGAEKPIWVPSWYMKHYGYPRTKNEEITAEQGPQLEAPEDSEDPRRGEQVRTKIMQTPPLPSQGRTRICLSRATQTMGSPSWGQIKCLTRSGRDVIRSARLTGAFFVAMLAIITPQVSGSVTQTQQH